MTVQHIEKTLGIKLSLFQSGSEKFLGGCLKMPSKHTPRHVDDYISFLTRGVPLSVVRGTHVSALAYASVAYDLPEKWVVYSIEDGKILSFVGNAPTSSDFNEGELCFSEDVYVFVCLSVLG